MRALVTAIALVVAACGAPRDMGAVAAPGGAADGGDVCGSIPPAYDVCADCHTEAETLSGWSSHPAGATLASDMWGRRAFLLLFTQASSSTIPAHRTPYDWPERCFCEGGDGTPTCRTLAGEFE